MANFFQDVSNIPETDIHAEAKNPFGINYVQVSVDEPGGSINVSNVLCLNISQARKLYSELDDAIEEYKKLCGSNQSATIEEATEEVNNG